MGSLIFLVYAYYIYSCRSGSESAAVVSGSPLGISAGASGKKRSTFMCALDFNNSKLGHSVTVAVAFMLVLFILLECWSWSTLQQSADSIDVRLTSLSSKLDRIMLQMLWGK